MWVWVGETCSHSEHVFPKLLTPNSENFVETCSESEKRVLSRRNVFSLRTRFSKTPNSQLRKFCRNVFSLRTRFSEKRAPESEKCALSQRNVFSLRTRFSKTPNSQLRKFCRNVFWVGETCCWVGVGETCSHSEHVFPKLLTPNSENFVETCSESGKRALSRRNVFSFRTRFSKTPNS